MMLPGFKPVLPERIKRLDELANNLWWSWHENARGLFRALDYSQWRLSGHNPVKQILEMSPEKLKAAAIDPEFLTLYDSVMADFDEDLASEKAWISMNHPKLRSGMIAYFSAEFAIHRSLPIYAGGLGVLAGDLCKEASDMGLPLVAVGFMYPQGYFQQRISADGWQEENYQQIKFEEAPITPCPLPATCKEESCLIPLEMNGKEIWIKAWLVHVGEVNLYLLDTDCKENSATDRQLSARLYTADREQRIQQEFVLGVGGVRLLRMLGIKPTVWHANEGHTVFMMLERAREEVKAGVPFQQALDHVRETTVFTTHTPVPAGHDVFPSALVEKYLTNFEKSLGVSHRELMQMGSIHPDETGFNMTVFGMKTANYRNAVSRLHQDVTRKMFREMWPDKTRDEIPITYITNGVHLPTWIAPELHAICKKFISSEFFAKQDEVEICQRVAEIPDADFWEIRQTLRRKLIQNILESAQKRWVESNATPQQVLTMGALLDTETLTVGFVRRFAEYKRPSLLFHDKERLKRIINNRWRPVQIIFAGKSHPADFPSKTLLHQVYELASNREFQGRIAFVEDYDMHIARFLTQGVDVWLNNPRRGMEACGTSGMKASMNGVPHLSILDGWWDECYNKMNGWAIGPGPEAADHEQDDEDAESIYRLLEEQIVPSFYERDRDGVPHGWISLVKEAFRTVVPQYCARRMLKEYTERMYVPANEAFSARSRTK
jgi:glycogen phosphorylase